MKKLLIVFVVVVLATGGVFAQNFPTDGPTDDVTTSLGMFIIEINLQYRHLFLNNPAYDQATGTLTSPVLYDPATVIGRSAVHLHDPNLTGADYLGVPVGTAQTTVGDINFTVWPPGFQGPPNTRELHTKVHSMNMTSGRSAVRAGLAAEGAILMSPGEVESMPGGNDFPAESFFDVFVEVVIPGAPADSWGDPDSMIVGNGLALMVEADSLQSLPPKVVYIHRNSTAVPVQFRNSHPTYWTEGQVLGFLILAGHGVGYDDGGEDTQSFMNTMDTVTPMPVPPVPTTTPYGILILLALLILSAVYVLYKKRTTANV
ncbi:MAG: hypothetical protein OEV49_08640 [candidate division Zixibacteria bacterium]|nr:hypothetical protein [candidate division Zixibacteria bacterium]MDH3936865.1 hypothetical protein [candidate division Zixibacteria bacterium]MDH4033702.1 hypothetical protein [candidate division Zixibacteria bacterium]